ncbi:MAG: response regulator transcription factor [Desulfobacterales bacterium]
MRKRTILMVDSSEMMRSAARQMLRTRYPDVKILEADAQETAFDIVKKHRPGLVITDVRLRSGNGLDLTEKIVRHFPDHVVVVFTSDDTPEYEAAALKRGASFFVSKTETSDPRLWRVVQTVLEPSSHGS